MKEINCIGDFCPVPILKIQKALETCSPGDSFDVISDHDCVRESIEEYLGRMQFTYTITELDGGLFRVTIKKKS